MQPRLAVSLSPSPQAAGKGILVITAQDWPQYASRCTLLATTAPIFKEREGGRGILHCIAAWSWLRVQQVEGSVPFQMLTALKNLKSLKIDSVAMQITLDQCRNILCERMC